MTPPVDSTTQEAARKRFGVLRLYPVYGSLGGLVSLAMLLSIPADPKNAWLFGFSRSRMNLRCYYTARAAAFLVEGPQHKS